MAETEWIWPCISYISLSWTLQDSVLTFCLITWSELRLAFNTLLIAWDDLKFILIIVSWWCISVWQDQWVPERCCMMPNSVERCLGFLTMPHRSKYLLYSMNATHVTLEYSSSLSRSPSFCHFLNRFNDERRYDVIGVCSGSWANWNEYAQWRADSRYMSLLCYIWTLFGHAFDEIWHYNELFWKSYKFEYSNTFFVVQSFVGIEIEWFLATFVSNRRDNVSLAGLGVYIGID